MDWLQIALGAFILILAYQFMTENRTLKNLFLPKFTEESCSIFFKRIFPALFVFGICLFLWNFIRIETIHYVLKFIALLAATYVMFCAKKILKVAETEQGANRRGQIE